MNESLGFKLKQYVDAKFDELALKGSSNVEGYEEAQLWVQELEEEIDQLTSQ